MTTYRGGSHRHLLRGGTTVRRGLFLNELATRNSLVERGEGLQGMD